MKADFKIATSLTMAKAEGSQANLEGMRPTKNKVPKGPFSKFHYKQMFELPALRQIFKLPELRQVFKLPAKIQMFKLPSLNQIVKLL